LDCGHCFPWHGLFFIFGRQPILQCLYRNANKDFIGRFFLSACSNIYCSIARTDHVAPTSLQQTPYSSAWTDHVASEEGKKRLNWMNWWSSVVSLYYISFCRDDDGPGRSPTPAPCRGRSSQPLRHGFGVRLLVTLQPLLGFSVLRLIAEGFIHPVEKSLIAVEHQYALRLKVYTGMFFLLINSCHTIYFADAELLTSLNPFSFSSFEVLDLYRKF
jgi:hypothetical protein